MEILAPLISIVILIYSAILHEIAHGYVAYRLGDPTAKLLGRLTLNPIPHIDPLMSLLIPALLIFSGSPVIFGGAKPVPVDPFNLRDGRKDLALVSLVGPLTNVLLAILASILVHLFFSGMSFTEVYTGSILGRTLGSVILINLSLAIFNLLPLPPLDGSKIFSLLLPAKQAARYLSLGSIGMLILMALLLFPVGGISIMGLIGSLIGASLSLLGL